MTDFDQESFKPEHSDTSSFPAVRMLAATAMLLSPLWLFPLLLWTADRFGIPPIQGMAHLDNFIFALIAIAIITLIGLVWLAVALPEELPRINQWLKGYGGTLTVKRVIVGAVLAVFALLALAKPVVAILARSASASPSAPAPLVRHAPQNATSPTFAPEFFTDKSGLLTTMQAQELSHRLRDFHTKSGATVAVLLVPDLGGQSIDEFASLRFSEWFTVRPSVDDIILVVIARRENHVKIELGSDFKHIQSDSPRLIHELGQAFSRGEFYGGISVCVDALMEKAK